MFGVFLMKYILKNIFWKVFLTVAFIVLFHYSQGCNLHSLQNGDSLDSYWPFNYNGKSAVCLLFEQSKSAAFILLKSRLFGYALH